MADSPFYQPARQNFSSSQSMQQPQGGFGGFGGYQMPQQNFGGGFGDGFQPQQQGFGGFGGGQGFGGFNPFQGGFGGFQQQQQFSPFQGGFGGGFQPQGFGGFGGGFNPYQGGFGGGYNPMFGGIGGLGFNPMMGQGFGMPMQGFNPYQQQMQQVQLQQVPPQFQPQQNAPSMDMMYRGGPEMSPEMRQRREQDMRSAEGMAQQPQAPVDSGINKGVDKMSVGPEFNSRQPMYGGIGGLGFNPMMGPQFGMPMQGFNPMMGQQFSSDHMGDMMSRGGPEMSRLSELQRGLARQQERLMGTRDMPLTADQKYQQAQQFGNQAYLHRPEVRQANQDNLRRMQEAALAARG